MADRKLSSFWPLGGGLALLGAMACVALGVVLVVYFDYRSSMDAKVLERGESVELRIPDGASWGKTRSILGRSGLVEDPVYFDLWARWRELPRSIRAGRHQLNGPMTYPQMARALQRGGRPGYVRVTFPEGYSIFEMGDELADEGVVSRAAFLEAVRDEELLSEYDIGGDSFEGYLFPDTYEFAPDASPRDVVVRLHERWREVWEDVRRYHSGAVRGLSEEFGLDRHGIVTLASIVAAETAVEDEQPKVARVMLNRLRESMRLQADPTCVYGPKRYGETPSPKWCRKHPNRYSTYAHDGLPPGPIGNPGRRSLEAVLDPATGNGASEYLFYCSRNDGSGRHVFTKSYEAHKRAIDRYLK